MVMDFVFFLFFDLVEEYLLFLRLGVGCLLFFDLVEEYLL